MGQILSYPEDTALQTTDRFLFQDGTTNAYKRIPFGDLKSNIVGAAWTSWTPSWTNLTVGAATVEAKYIQIGKTVHWYLYIALSGSSMGTGPIFSLPVTAAAYTQQTRHPIGYGDIVDVGVQDYAGKVYFASTTTAVIVAQAVHEAGATDYIKNVALDSSTPFAWGNGDYMALQGSYQAA